MRVHSEKTKIKISTSLMGHSVSEETRKKISVASLGHIAWNKGKPNTWTKGSGKTKLSVLVRTSEKYILWRNYVYERDKYTCVLCQRAGGNLNADHIIPLSKLLSENDIKNIQEALRCDKLWDVNNGRTLCVPCHRNTITYGLRIYKNVTC